MTNLAVGGYLIRYHSDQPGDGLVDDKKIQTGQSGSRPDDDDRCRRAAAQ